MLVKRSYVLTRNRNLIEIVRFSSYRGIFSYVKKVQIKGDIEIAKNSSLTVVDISRFNCYSKPKKYLEYLLHFDTICS